MHDTVCCHFQLSRLQPWQELLSCCYEGGSSLLLPIQLSRMRQPREEGTLLLSKTDQATFQSQRLARICSPIKTSNTQGLTPHWKIKISPKKDAFWIRNVHARKRNCACAQQHHHFFPPGVHLCRRPFKRRSTKDAFRRHVHFRQQTATS